MSKNELKIGDLVECPFIKGNLRIKQIYHTKVVCEVIEYYGRLIELEKLDVEYLYKIK